MWQSLLALLTVIYGCPLSTCEVCVGAQGLGLLAAGPQGYHFERYADLPKTSSAWAGGKLPSSSLKDSIQCNHRHIL